MARVNCSKPKLQSVDILACCSFRTTSLPDVDMSWLIAAWTLLKNFELSPLAIGVAELSPLADNGVVDNEVETAPLDSAKFIFLKFRDVDTVVDLLVASFSAVAAATLCLIIGFGEVAERTMAGCLLLNECSFIVSCNSVVL